MQGRGGRRQWVIKKSVLSVHVESSCLVSMGQAPFNYHIYTMYVLSQFPLCHCFRKFCDVTENSSRLLLTRLTACVHTNGLCAYAMLHLSLRIFTLKLDIDSQYSRLPCACDCSYLLENFSFSYAQITRYFLVIALPDAEFTSF